jgi:hypothetical protein
MSPNSGSKCVIWSNDQKGVLPPLIHHLVGFWVFKDHDVLPVITT